MAWRRSNSIRTVPDAATTGDDARDIREHPAAKPVDAGSARPCTVHLPDGEGMFIYGTSHALPSRGVPLIVIAGREYGPVARR